MFGFSVQQITLFSADLCYDLSFVFLPQKKAHVLYVSDWLQKRRFRRG